MCYQHFYAVKPDYQPLLIKAVLYIYINWFRFILDLSEDTVHAEAF